MNLKNVLIVGGLLVSQSVISNVPGMSTEITNTDTNPTKSISKRTEVVTGAGTVINKDDFVPNKITSIGKSSGTFLDRIKKDILKPAENAAIEQQNNKRDTYFKKSKEEVTKKAQVKHENMKAESNTTNKRQVRLSPREENIKIVKNFCEAYSKITTNGENIVKNISHGVNTTIVISKDYLNRIETPFNNVMAYSNNSALKTIRQGADKNVLMVSTKKPFSVPSMFLQDKMGNVANLTVFACKLPPQNIVLKFDTLKQAEIDPFKPRQQALKWEMSGTYVEKVTDLVSTVIAGDVPAGYEYQELNDTKVGTVCKTKGLDGRMQQLLEGSKIRVGVFLATNRSDKIIDIDESKCYVENVLAVSAYPNVSLRPGEFTEIIVAFKKKSKPKNRLKTRKVLVK